MLRVELKEIAIANDGSYALLLLSTEAGEIVPITVDLVQARAITIGRSREKPSRPLTHDLLLNSLSALNAKLKRVEISDLREGTYYGYLIIENRGIEYEIDARPSDAIALAVREGVDIFISDEIVEKNSMVEDMSYLSGAAEA